jgi:ribosomal protein S27E
MINRIKSISLVLLLLLGCFFVIIDLLSYEVQGESWHTEIVDSNGNVGSFTSMVLDDQDHPHISYFDESNYWLKYAKWTGNDWNIEVIDTDCGGFYPKTSIALDENNRPHIAYESDSDYCLKYARWTGSSWIIQTVDPTYSTGDFASLALDSNDNPHISYFYRNNGDLRYAKWTGGNWEISTAASGTWVGEESSLALDSNDNPYISYRDSDDEKLKLARWSGGAWNIETIYDGTPFETCIAIDSNDNPHISFYKTETEDLCYARWTGSWVIQTIDSSGDVGRWPSLALDGDDHPHISYYDWDNEDLKYAEWTGNEWNIRIIDSQYNGQFSSIALDSSENVHFSYFEDRSKDLKYAKPNNPPLKPITPSGPTSGFPGTSYEYSTSTTDPNDDQIFFTFDWGDGTTSETDYVNSQVQVLESHSWQNSGNYHVKIKATDVHGATSGWSNSVIIEINTPPETPTRPSGPSEGENGISYYFTSRSSDPDGDNIKYTFDWGDGTTTVSNFVNSNITANRSHTWSDPGNYQIKVKVTDTYGSHSDWSKIFTIVVLENNPPNIILKSPFNNSVLIEPAIIEFDITDSNLDSVTCSRNNMNFIVLTPPYTLDTTSWEDGKNKLIIRATDYAGNIQERWYEFHTDYTPPEIISNTPNNYEVGIDCETDIVLEFSEPMNCDSVESAFFIAPYNDLTFSWSDNNQTLSVKFQDNLDYSTYYDIAIGTRASDKNGHGLERKYEFGFTTIEDSEEDNEGFTPLIFLIFLVVVAIVITAVAIKMGKNKTPLDNVSSKTMKIQCSNCQGIFQVRGSGTPMNVSCPFCSSLLTTGVSRKPSSKAPASQSTLSISCPQCNYNFNIVKSSTPTYIQCPKCGTSGTVR